MKKSETTRGAVKRVLAGLPQETLDRIAMMIETADVQGGWSWDGENSVFEDDVQRTLGCLADEFRALKTRRLT